MFPMWFAGAMYGIAIVVALVAVALLGGSAYAVFLGVATLVKDASAGWLWGTGAIFLGLSGLLLFLSWCKVTR